MNLAPNLTLPNMVAWNLALLVAVVGTGRVAGHFGGDHDLILTLTTFVLGASYDHAILRHSVFSGSAKDLAGNLLACSGLAQLFVSACFLIDARAWILWLGAAVVIDVVAAHLILVAEVSIRKRWRS